MQYFSSSCVYLYMRGTDEQVSSLAKKEGMFYETFKNRLWPGTHSAMYLSRKPGSSGSRWERRHHQLLSGDCDLLPLFHLRSWPPQESAAKLVLPQPPSPDERRSQSTGGRYQYHKPPGGCPSALGTLALPRALVFPLLRLLFAFKDFTHERQNGAVDGSQGQIAKWQRNHRVESLVKLLLPAGRPAIHLGHGCPLRKQQVDFQGGTVFIQLKLASTVKL